ncbi:aldo/keto reductase [Radiobacillus deserti]|uniref:Aldo/keto reductase n=1 Tax=Radiobacillus deserti TaxID=2594883 RepID=A0A516KJI5_9BACI|nr:aldo/keto reductase [Radiobacillus deserti]QDP41546.1 aldo/keto reductase [Radiobacillus deserti]
MSNLNENTNRPGGTYSLGEIEVARVGYGTMQLPKLKEEADAKAILRKAYELGVNHFDTADFYGNGIANRYLAEELGNEKDAVFVTKIGAKPTKRGPLPMLPAQRPEELRQHIQDNLKSLKTDHLNIVNFRRIAPGTFPLKPSQKINFDDQMAELIAMRDEGLFGAIGLSSVSLEELEKALPSGIVCVQNQYNLTSRSQEPVLELCKKEGIAWVPFFPLGGGLPGSAKVTADPVVQEVAKEMGISPVQVGLAWLLQHTDNTLIIPGTTSISHLEQNIAVGSIRFNEKTMKRLDAVKAAKGLGALVNKFMSR